MIKKRFFTELACLTCITLFSAACSGNDSSVSYEFTTVRRGTLERTVLSSGTIQPVSIVRILPQMSGKVEKVYVEYNDIVQRGDILAELNTDMLRLRRDQQHAVVARARSNHRLQQQNYNSQLLLAERNFISEFELLTSLTNLENLESELRVAEANLRVIETEINQYAFITSPIDGIVLDRMINEGDTVSDSSSGGANSIFTLAENLREMQIEASIGELDVSSIYRGQAVRFTLESLPGRRFAGVVENYRMVPSIVNNVVSYTVIIRVDNHDGSLLPGMTCAVEFIVARSENALLISNAALRYQPTGLNPEEIDEKIFYAGLDFMNEEQRAQAIIAREQTLAETAANTDQNQRQSIISILTGGNRNSRPRATQAQARAIGDQEGIRYLWYMTENGNLEVMQVRIGIVTGSATELLTAADIEGRQFISRERL